MGDTEIIKIFKALSDENRVRILSIIAGEEDICACTILEELGITQPTLSHHMKVLCTCKLVACRKEGKWMHYSLDRKALACAESYLSDLAATT